MSSDKEEEDDGSPLEILSEEDLQQIEEEREQREGSKTPTLKVRLHQSFFYIFPQCGWSL